MDELLHILEITNKKAIMAKSVFERNKYEIWKEKYFMVSIRSVIGWI